MSQEPSVLSGLSLTERIGSGSPSQKVALVHDWLTGLRGGERCLLNFLDLYPQADIFALLHVPGTTAPRIDARVKQTSFLQHIPGIQKFYRYFLPLYPLAVRSLNLQGYDLVISLSHAAAKNVMVDSGAMHICYCFTPMRYVWDQVRSYFGAKSFFLWPIISLLRKWDKNGAGSVTQFVAISRFVASRIRKFYRRNSVVVFPPVDTSWISAASPGERGEAFLYAGALVPYKRPDAVIRAFNELGLPLWVAGTGPEELKLRGIARKNIQFLGRVSDEELADRYRRCRALLFPGKEDFGMIPIECLAAGRPVIGIYEGALRESLVGAKPWEEIEEGDFAELCGVFMNPKEPSKTRALIQSVRYFIEHERLFRVESCTKRASLFSVKQFEQCWARLVDALKKERSKGKFDSHKSAHVCNFRTSEILGVHRFAAGGNREQIPFSSKRKVAN